MIKQTLLLLLLALQCMLAAAQHRFQAGIGYQRTWMIDKQVSPLKYQSSEKTFLLGYEYASQKRVVRAKIDGSLGKFFPTGYDQRQLYDPGYNADGTPKKDSFPLTGKLYSVNMQVAYLTALSDGFSKWGSNTIHTNDYVGASLNNQLFYTDNIVRTGWLNSSSLNADYQHAILFNTRHSFNIRISIPLFARNSRLPYHNTISSPEGDSGFKTFFKQGSRFTWLADFQNIQINATYEYAIGKRTGLGLHYTGQWMHYKHEAPVTFFQNNIGVIATVK